MQAVGSFSLHYKNGKKVIANVAPKLDIEKYTCLTAGLKPVKLTVTHRMSSDVFAGIFELGRVGKKKGGKKRGKRKVSSFNSLSMQSYYSFHSICLSEKIKKFHFVKTNVPPRKSCCLGVAETAKRGKGSEK